MITLLIIALTSLVSISAFSNGVLFQKMVFNAYIINHNREWYRFFSHGLIHADWMHLLMNMFVLYSFGTAVEEAYFPLLFGEVRGALNFSLIYAGALIVSSYPSYEKNKNNSYYNSVGASGAVSAIVFAGILINPLSEISFMFIPFPIPAFLFGGAYLIYSWYMTKKGRDNIGHDAHFWGAVYGFVTTGLFKPNLFLYFFERITNSF